MKIYIDDDFHCHTDNLDGTFREFDLKFFDGKCQSFIEGYRYCPPCESYTRDDGEVFYGESIAPWKPYSELDTAQREYEKQIVIEHNQVLQELGVEVNS